MSNPADHAPGILDGLDLDHLVAHLLSLGSLVMVLVGWLPALATLAALVWYVLSIWETPTVRGWFKRQGTPTQHMALAVKAVDKAQAALLLANQTVASLKKLQDPE